MANLEHVQVVQQGAQALADWRAVNPDVRLDLDNAEFDALDNGLDLRFASLRGARISGVCCEGIDLRHAVLWSTRIARCELRHAKLDFALFGEPT